MRQFSDISLWFLTVFVTCSIASGRAHAQEIAGSEIAVSKVATVPLTTLEHPEDPYSVHYRFTDLSKKYAGQIVETDRFRHPVLLKETKGFIEFANFFHNGKYWIAKVSKTALLDKIYFHVVKFPAVPGVTAAHTQYRVVFKENGIQLRSQTGGNEVDQVSDIVISYEAARPAGYPYSFIEGIEDNYAIVARALSGQQRANESLETPTEQHELLLNGHEAIEMLTASIHQGNSEKFYRFYNTLYPNCTTEVFNRIDELSTRKNLGFKKFLTVLSNDPIAGPSLKDLKKRRLLGSRGPDLSAEFFEGQKTYVPSTDDNKPALGLFPERLAEQYSLVIHTSNEEKLTQTQREIIEKAQKDLYQFIAQVLQSSLSLTALDQKDAQDLFQQGLLKISEALKTFVLKMDETLPSDLDSKVTIHFVPFVGSEKDEITDRILREVPARLPFKTYRAVIDKNSGRDDLYQVRMAPKKVRLAFQEEAQRKNLSLNPFHIVGSAIQVHLKKGSSSVKVQITGSLNPVIKKLGIEQGPARLDALHTVSPEKSGDKNQSLILIGLEQQVGNEKPPQVHVDFGYDMGPKSSMSSGLFTVDGGQRLERLRSVPYFLGEETYFNIDLRFPILSMDVDLESLSLSQINLRVFKPFFRFSVGSKKIDEQFRAGINKQIADLKEKITSDGGESLFQKIFTASSSPSTPSNCDSALSN